TTALKADVGFVFFQFVPHRVKEQFLVDDSGANGDGVLFLQQGKYDAAVDAFRRVFSADPTAAGALYDLAIAYLAKGDDDSAAEMLSRSLALRRWQLSQSLLDRVRERIGRRRVVGSQ